MIRAWNLAADALGNSDFISLPQYEGASGGSGLFLLLCGLALWAAGYAFFAKQENLAAGCLAAAVLFVRISMGTPAITVLLGSVSVRGSFYARCTACTREKGICPQW